MFLKFKLGYYGMGKGYELAKPDSGQSKLNSNKSYFMQVGDYEPGNIRTDPPITS